MNSLTRTLNVVGILALAAHLGFCAPAMRSRAFAAPLGGAVEAPPRAPLTGRAATAISAAERGVVCDGVTDAAPALQAIAGSLSQATPAEIDLPFGICRLASAVTFRTAVKLVGQGYTEGATTDSVGTTLKIDKTGFVPVTFAGYAARGSAIRDLSVIQLQHAALTPGWAPDDYDFVFKILDTLGGIEFTNVQFNGVAKGIFASNSGRLNINDVIGQFFTTAIEIDDCYDIARIGRLHSWTFNTANRYVVAYQQQHLDNVILRRVDGIFIDDLFTIAARSSIRFTGGARGVTTKAYIDNLYSDLGRYGIWVDGSGANTSFQAANITAQGNDFNNGATPLKGATGIRIEAAGVHGQIGTLRTDLMDDSAITITATDVHLDIASFWASGYNSHRNGSPAIATLTSDVVNLGSASLMNGNGGPLTASAAGVYRDALINMPAGAVNEPRFYGAAAGKPVTLGPIGDDANTDMVLFAKGRMGSVRLGAGAAPSNVFRVDNPGGGDTGVLLRSGTGGAALIAESGSKDAGITVAPKGGAAFNIDGSGGLQLGGVPVISGSGVASLAGLRSGGETNLQAAEDHALATVAASFTFDASMRDVVVGSRAKPLAAAVTARLPPCVAAIKGRSYGLKKVDASSRGVVLAAATANGQTGLPDLIDGAATVTLATQYAQVDVQCDGAGNWWRHAR